MKSTTLMLGATALAAFLFVSAPNASSATSDEVQIKALEADLSAAASVKDIDTVMRFYAPGDGLFAVDDTTPQHRYLGAAAYRTDWAGLLASFAGPIKFQVTQFSVVSDGVLAYGHSTQHVSGNDTHGAPYQLTVHVTDVYRKMGGTWKIVLEHTSVPVDLDTAKADLNTAD